MKNKKAKPRESPRSYEHLSYVVICLTGSSGRPVNRCVSSSLLPGDEAAGAPLMGDWLEGHGSSLYSVA